MRELAAEWEKVPNYKRVDPLRQEVYDAWEALISLPDPST
jgi:hypothetical protein